MMKLNVAPYVKPRPMKASETMDEHLFRGCVYPARPCTCSDPPPEPFGYRPEELRALLGPTPNYGTKEFRAMYYGDFPAPQPAALLVDDPVRPEGSGRVSPEAQRAAVDWARGTLGDPSIPGTFDRAGRYYGVSGEREHEPGTEGKGSRASAETYLRLNPDAIPGLRARFREITGRDFEPRDFAPELPPLNPEGFGGSDFPYLDGPAAYDPEPRNQSPERIGTPVRGGRRW